MKCVGKGKQQKFFREYDDGKMRFPAEGTEAMKPRKKTDVSVQLVV